MKQLMQAIAARAMKVVGIVVLVLALMIGTTPFSSPAKAGYPGVDPLECAAGCDSYLESCMDQRAGTEYAEYYCRIMVAKCKIKCFEYASQM